MAARTMLSRGSRTSALKAHGGFTLLELIVVCGIIVLLLSFIGPAVTALSKSNNLSTSGRILANLLTVARSEAINQRRLIQLRVATKWMDLQGNEDITASYRKFSVWRKPSPEDPQQSSDPNDPYIQVSNWETLPAGITFADNTSGYTLPTAPDARNPGSYFLTLGTSKSGIKVSSGTANVAWIEFNPSGGANYSG